MSVEQEGKFGQERVSGQREPQLPEHPISFTLAVADPHARWAAAAAKLLRRPDKTLDGVCDATAPRDDPAVTKPNALADRVLDEFWIDSLRGAPPRIDLTGTLLEYKMMAAEMSPRRPSHKRRRAPHLALCMLPPLLQDEPGAPPSAQPD